MSKPHIIAGSLGTQLELIQVRLNEAKELQQTILAEVNEHDFHPWESYDLADFPGLRLSVNPHEKTFLIMAGRVNVTDYVDGSIYAYCKRNTDKILGQETSQTQTKPNIL